MIPLFETHSAAEKRYRRGTHRAVSPATTLAALTPRLRELGITRVADITGLDTVGLPVYVAVRPTSRALSTSQGKGLDHDSAKVSAIMESIEAWHAERVSLPIVHESYRDLCRRALAVDPCSLEVAAGQVGRHDVPYLWVRGWDLLVEDWRFVPFELVTLNFVFPGGYRPTFNISSNGLASGNHPLEATLHGLTEVVERDAHRVWQTRSETRATVDLASIDDEGCREVLNKIEAAGLGVVVWDITSDIGVPAYTCQIVPRVEDARWRAVGPAGGHGCHPSRAVALMRALTEAVQSRLTVISGSRDDMFYRDYEATADRDNVERAERMRASSDARTAFRSREELDTPTLDGDLRVVCERLRAVGIDQAVVVDLSRPDVDIPVVKVVVPGLAGYASGVSHPRLARASEPRGRS